MEDARPVLPLLRAFFAKLSETEEVMLELLQQPHDLRLRKGERASSPPVAASLPAEA